MGNLYRWLLGGLLLAVSLTAFSETTPSATYMKYGTGSNYTGPFYGPEWITPNQSACAAAVLERFPSTGYTGVLEGSTCRIKNSSGGAVGTQNSYIFRVGCPDESWTLSAGTCTRQDCVAPQVRQPDGTCQTPNPCAEKAGQTGTAWYIVPKGQDVSGRYCKDSCQVEVSFGPAGFAYTNGTMNSLNRSFIFTGATCAGSDQPMPSASTPEPPNPAKRPPCAATEGVLTSSAGGVKCVPSGTPTANTPDVSQTKSKSTYPDGSTSETTTTKTRDPGTGETTTSKETTNTPGPGGGTQAGEPGTGTENTDSDGKDKDTQDFCEKHPDSMVCKNSTFSGSCTDGEAAPSCEGDAALCAAAKAAYELRCGALDAKGTEYGKNLIDGSDPRSAELPNPNNPQNFAVNGLSYSDVGGSCPPDLTFNILGRSSTVSMAGVCSLGGWLGNIGVALSLLVAGFIVVGAIRNS